MNELNEYSAGAYDPFVSIQEICGEDERCRAEIISSVIKKAILAGKICLRLEAVHH